MPNAPAEAIHMVSNFYRIAPDSTTLKLDTATANYEILAAATQNVDVIDRSDIPGVRIVFFGAVGTAAVTFRDNQSGTNIVLDSGASNARVVDDNERLELQLMPDGKWHEVAYTAG